MIPIRVLCYYLDGKKTMISVMVPEERYHQDSNIEDVVLELANETLTGMGREKDIVLMEVLQND